ncbi:hypothetical protein DRP53_09870 [candidate division WOR-3 bacterium]|uniref:DUF4878 domain-containing protein n=1 Tax=candidate division WOR-3 bacterium TaxID=2052148 RepID=A0A660SDJ1_UNCW3|nr:MAG: hypothetical protein DRP53_09870 [candidate division WOR-3 bacterium]
MVRRIKFIGIIVVAALITIGAVKTFYYKSDPENLHYHSYRFTEEDKVALTVAKFIRAVELGNDRDAYRLLSKTEGSYKKAYTATKSYCDRLKVTRGGLLASLKLVRADVNGSEAKLIYQIVFSSAIDTIEFYLIKERDVWRISPTSVFFARLSKEIKSGVRKAGRDG